jgi:hypothetical protein
LPYVIAFMLMRSTTPRNLSSEPIGHLERDGVHAEAVADHVDDAPEVGAGAVELVDEAEARDAVLVRLRQTVSDCGSTPATPSKTTTRRRARAGCARPRP